MNKFALWTWMLISALGCILLVPYSLIALEDQVSLEDMAQIKSYTEADSKFVPSQINYQGFLIDPESQEEITATLEMTFKIYAEESGGTELWYETHPAVEVSQGLFSVFLGNLTPFQVGLFNGTTRWLQTEVGSEVLVPRKPLVSVVYSLLSQEAEHAVSSDWATYASDAQHAIMADTANHCPAITAWTIDQEDIYRPSGRVGIGLTNPSYTLDVAGTINATTYYGDGSHLTGLTRSPDEDWIITGTNMYAGVSGNVGIGIASPAYKLHVNGSVNATTYYGDGSHLTGISGFSDTDWTIDDGDIYHLEGSVGIGTSSPSYPLHVVGAVNATTYYGDGSHLTGISSADGDWAMTGDDISHVNGKVGIGTSSPAEKLHVLGNTKIEGTLIASYLSGNNSLRLQTSGVTRMFLDNATGNVGVGTMSPAYLLDVSGSVRASDFYGNGSHLTGIETGPDDDWIIDGDTIYRQLGRIGIGTDTPEAKLHVESDSSENVLLAKGGWSYPVLAEYNGSNSGAAICAKNTGSSGDALLAIAQGSGRSAIHALAGPSANYAVWGESNDADWAGFFSGNLHASGKVGMGTASPEAKVHIDGSGEENALLAKGSWSYPIMAEWGGSGQHAALLAKNTGSSGDAIQAIMEGSGRSALFAQGAAGAEYAIMASSNGATWAGYLSGNLHANGQVGIGTTSLGSHQLTVLSSGSGPSGATVHAKNDAADGTAMSLENTSTEATLILTQSGTGDLMWAQTPASKHGEAETIFRIRNDGRIIGAVLELTGGSDLAEPFNISSATQDIQPGMLVCIDPHNPGKLALSSKAYDRTVAGIISGAGQINPGMIMGQVGSVADGRFPVALSGRVYCWANASNGSIQPGDLMTSSQIPGYAMKATDPSRTQGAVIGKAMSSLESGQGLVLVLVTLQ